MKIIIIIIILLSGVCIVKAQWQADVRLTNNSAGSYVTGNNGSNIGAKGDTIHVTWTDWRNSDNPEIYYKRSTDGGSNWGQDTRLTNNLSSSYPFISVSAEDVHLVWSDNRDGNFEIYYKHSSNSGDTWGPDTRLTNNTFTSLYSPVSASGQDLHIAWVEDRDGNEEIYYKRSTNNGITWSSDIRLTINDSISYYPSISATEQNVHIVWHDVRDGNPRIYYKRSTDGGSTWLPDIPLSDLIFSLYPCISVNGQTVHVTWEDGRDGNGEIYYKKSTNGGVNWGTDTRLTNNPLISTYPFVYGSGSNIHLAWSDNRDGNFEIYYKLSSDNGTNWGPDTRLTNAPNESFVASLTTSGNEIHSVWSDKRDGNFEIYYKNNPMGNLVNIANITTEIPSEYILEQNYPNPFNPGTNIKFSIPVQGLVSLRIYNTLGQVVTTLVSKDLSAGQYEANFDASKLTSGIYFYKLEAEGFTEIKKMMLVK